ncbi:MAG: hypothetical protein NTV51_22210 [Verrucomicrobia bacterium]|nr:hypothetical protein [Verrucomicrobiota bacterium]
MKIFNQSGLDVIGLAAIQKGLFYGIVGITFLVDTLLFQIDTKYDLVAVRVAATLILCLGLFLVFYTVPEAINKMRENKGMYPREAFGHTFRGYVLATSFLPLVGRFIGRVLEPRKPVDPFTTPDK